MNPSPAPNQGPVPKEIATESAPEAPGPGDREPNYKNNDFLVKLIQLIIRLKTAENCASLVGPESWVLSDLSYFRQTLQNHINKK